MFWNFLRANIIQLRKASYKIDEKQIHRFKQKKKEKRRPSGFFDVVLLLYLSKFHCN